MPSGRKPSLDTEIRAVSCGVRECLAQPSDLFRWRGIGHLGCPSGQSESLVKSADAASGQSGNSTSFGLVAGVCPTARITN